MDEDLLERIKKLENRVKALEDYVSSIPTFYRPPRYEDGEDLDELYEKAVMIALQNDKLGASMLQRQLQIGFARTARILEQLEANGIIGPAMGSEPREVLIKDEDIENLRQKILGKKEKRRKN